VIWIIGGTISGNCAIGSRWIITRPPITVTIEITIATIGRSMKKRDIGYFAAPGAAGGACAATGFTVIPSRTFWSPSTTIRSPARRPSSTT